MKGSCEHAVAWRLFEKLRHKGAVPDENGAIHLYVAEEVYAVVTAELWGGWNVVTFYVPGARLDGGEDGSGGENRSKENVH